MNDKIKQVTERYVETIFSSREKRWSFSKLMFLGIAIVTVLVTIFSCVAMWYFNNIDPLIYLIPSVFTECAVVSGFYSYKSKAENEIKLDTQRKLISRLIAGEKAEQDICDEDEEDCG